MPDYNKACAISQCRLLSAVADLIADTAKAYARKVDTGVYRESAQRNIADARKALNEIELLIAPDGENP